MIEKKINISDILLGLILLAMVMFAGSIGSTVSVVDAESFNGTLLKTNVCDPTTSSDCVEVAEGNLKVILQDQTTDALELYLYQETGNLTIATNTLQDQYDINFTAGHGLVANEYIVLQEDNHIYQAQVDSVNGTLVTMDTKLDFNYTTAAFGRSVNTNMAVDGSTTEQIFMITPESGFWTVEWDIARIICGITDSTSMDTGKFGGLTALDRGFVLRKKDGDFNNFWNVKTNGQFADIAYDVGYDDRSPSGEFGFRVRKTWAGQAKSGVAIRLDSNLNEELQGLVQDDLTGLNDFRCRPIGSLTN